MKLDHSNLQVHLSLRPAPLGEKGNEIFLEVKVRPGTIQVDRDYLAGWVFSPTQMKLALRLQAAILAGVAFGKHEIRTDINGRTYLNAETVGFFHKRHLNAELRKIGF